MAHVIYDNFYLSNEVEDQFNSHLDLQQFCTVTYFLNYYDKPERVLDEK